MFLLHKVSAGYRIQKTAELKIMLQEVVILNEKMQALSICEFK